MQISYSLSHNWPWLIRVQMSTGRGGRDKTPNCDMIWLGEWLGFTHVWHKLILKQTMLNVWFTTNGGAGHATQGKQNLSLSWEMFKRHSYSNQRKHTCLSGQDLLGSLLIFVIKISDVPVIFKHENIKKVINMSGLL